MEKVSKEAVLSKTHYGIGIYAHILRTYYPNEIVLTLKGRDCGLCRNPFNADQPTLHIWIVKTDPNNALSAEYARHEDTANAIPAGDVFTFAELHYKQSGSKLLQTLNEEMCLHIGENRNYYGNHTETEYKQQDYYGNTQENFGKPQFSFFKAPISNTKPHQCVSLLDVYRYIVGDSAKQKTATLRAFTDSRQAKAYKANNFDYCTFSGTFTQRNDKALTQHSGLLCLDFDHLKDLETLFQRLLEDEYFDTQLLFRSPSGDGLKWVIPIDTAECSHANYFRAVANYIQHTYNVEVDKSGKDLSRACFLPHDPNAFINPLICNNYEQE